MKHAVLWTEWQERTLMTPKGAVFANKGDVVMVVVAGSISEALAELVAVGRKEPTEKPGG